MLSPLSLLWGTGKKGIQTLPIFFRNKATRRPTTAPTTSYSSSTATVSALLPLCGGIRTCPFQRKLLTLSRSLAGSLRPRESRALGGSDKARGMGGCSLPLGLFSLPAGPRPLATSWAWSQAWDRLGGREGLCGPHPVPVPSPAGVRTEQDLYVRLIDSVTKQVSPEVYSFPSLVAPLPHMSLTYPTFHEFLGQTAHAPSHQLAP